MALLQLPKIFRSARTLNSKSRRRRRQQKRSSTLAGVFLRQSAQSVAASMNTEDDTTVSSYTEGNDDLSECKDGLHPQSLSSSSASTTSQAVSWKSTTRKSFCKNQPLIAADPDSSKAFTSLDDGEDNDEPVVMLRQAMARELPESSWYYSSNHVMVNVERRKCMVAPLTRLATLDAMARQHAQAMADANELYHANPQELIETFTTTADQTNNTAATPTAERSSTPRRTIRIMGENVAAGESIRSMHAKMMHNATHRINILHRGYTHFGVGTAKSTTDGRLYMCQVYRG